MTATLIRHRTVLEPAGESRSGTHVRFSCKIEDDDELLPESVWLRREVWEDMGRPDKITVTVEPGDRLNDCDCPDGASGPDDDRLCVTCAERARHKINVD